MVLGAALSFRSGFNNHHPGSSPALSPCIMRVAAAEHRPGSHPCRVRHIWAVNRHNGTGNLLKWHGLAGTLSHMCDGVYALAYVECYHSFWGRR